MPKKPEPKRSADELKAAYQRAALELGDVTYQREVALPKRIEDLKREMLALNAEHAALAAKEPTSDG